MLRFRYKRPGTARAIQGTLMVQFATWPASVSCFRVWSDRDRFRETARTCLRPARSEADASRETPTMAAPYPGNVTPQVQTAQDAAAAPIIRTIGLSDLHQALRLGWEDFKAGPSHPIILCVIYPGPGRGLALTVLGYSGLPLLFPVSAGFALLAPFPA